MTYRAPCVAGVLALVLVLSGCSDDDGSTTGTTEAVTFGEGSIPESVPQDFPIPPDAAIGTTMVDRVNNRTEFRVTIPSDMESAVRFFEIGLVNQGYVVTASEGSAVEWSTRFSRGELIGTVFTTPQNPNITTSVVSINRS